MAGRFGSLDEGRYKAVILKWELGKSAQKGTTQLAFVCRLDARIDVVDGEDVEVETDPVERTVFRYITDGTIDSFVRDIHKLGYDRDEFDGLDPNSENPFDFYGKEILLEMKFEDYKGQQKERWEFAREKAAKLERKEISSLNAMFGSKLKKGAGGVPVAPLKPVQRTQSATRPSNDAWQDGTEIPF